MRFHLLSRCRCRSGSLVIHIVLAVVAVEVSFATVENSAVCVASVLNCWERASLPRARLEERWVLLMALREHDILYKSGVLWKSYKAIPFNRLQHIELRRSPIDRGLDLASLSFFTAGGNYGDLNIAGFRHEQAQQIRERILAIMNKEEHDES